MALQKLPELPKILSDSLPGERDLNTSSGLYRLAKDSGLQKDADRIIRLHSGERHKRFFAGGPISDFLDVLNVASYGVVGTLKGKGFMEGIKNRESFSDKDAFGRYGLSGVVMGIALDILTDPFVYIAPWKILGHVPGLMKAGKITKEYFIGKEVVKTVADPKVNASITFKTREGAAGFEFRGKRIEPIKAIVDRLSWTHAFGDPVYRETYELMMKNSGIAMEKASTLFKQIKKFKPETAEKLLKRAEDGRFQRTSIEELQRTLTPEEMVPVREFFELIDNNQKVMVGLGMLSKEKAAENLGFYLRQAYSEYEVFKRSGFASRTLGIKLTKKRIEGLTEEVMKERGQISDPAYLLFKTQLDQIKDIENAKFFKFVSNNFALTKVPDEFKGIFKQVSDTPKFRISYGAVTSKRVQVGEITERLKPLFKSLKHTAKLDKSVLNKIENLEKSLEGAANKQVNELNKFLLADRRAEAIIDTPSRIDTIPERLESIASEMKKFDNFESMFNSKVGLELEKLHVGGTLEAEGFKRMKDFFDHIKHPFKPGSTTLRKAFVVKEKAFNNAYGFGFDELKEQVGKVKKAFEDISEAEKIARIAARKGRKEARFPTRALAVGDELDDIVFRIQKVKAKALKLGVKAGRLFSKKEVSEAQSQLIKVIKKNFKGAVPRKFLTIVKNATDFNKLGKLVDKLSDDFAKLADIQMESLGMGNLNKAVRLRKEISKLAVQSAKLRKLDKRSIDDSFRNLEKEINDLQFAKEDIAEEINIIREGDLAGKFIPTEMHKWIDEIVEPSVGFGRALVGEFKHMKVVMSPAAIVRNMMSNTILNWWKLGIGPWRLDKYARGIMHIAKKDGMDRAARESGMSASTFAQQELRNDLNIATLEGDMLNKYGNIWRRIKTFMADIYGGEESWAKIVAFEDFLEKKGYKFVEGKKFDVPRKVLDQAWKSAESATFNYAQITPFIRKVRTSLWGVPFITFPLKATPIVIEASLKHTPRVAFFGKFRNGIENLSDVKETEEEKKFIPEWIRDGFFVKLPMKDKFGRSAYFDLTYIMPFGDLVTGQMFQRQIRRTGLKEGVVASIVSVNPAMQFIKEIMRNETFTGDRVFKETDSVTKQLFDVANHFNRTMLPPFLSDNLPGPYNDKGERKPTGIRRSFTAGNENLRRTPYQELFRNIGLKTVPIDEEIQRNILEYNKRRALQGLLKDNGIVKDFSIIYKPKQPF